MDVEKFSQGSTTKRQVISAGKARIHPIVRFTWAAKLAYQEAPVIMQSSLTCKAVERILERSADLQIKRRATAKWSFEYHELSVAIATYGDVLEVLTTLQRQEEEPRVSLDLLASLEWAPGPHAVA